MTANPAPIGAQDPHDGPRVTPAGSGEPVEPFTRPARRQPRPLDSASVLAPCPYCGSPAGRGCVTRAAHPVTGRAFLAPAATHPERTRAASL